MTLRTPRRRISPRTKERCRAIKNFLRRALGSQSQPDFQNNSSLFVGFSDLKQKILGIEKELNTVSKHCQNLASFEYNLSPICSETASKKDQHRIDLKEDTNSNIFREPETKILYHTSQDRIRKQTNSNLISKKHCEHDDETKKHSQQKMTCQELPCHYKERERRKRYDRLDPIEEGEQILRSHRNHTLVENLPIRNRYRFCKETLMNKQPDIGDCELHRNKKRNKKEGKINGTFRNEHNNHFIQVMDQYHKNKSYRHKCQHTEVGQEFIADIIKRQYRPVTLFGRRDSDFSQFSAPVCRDQDFPIRAAYHEDSELCSCCHLHQRHEKHSRYMCSNDLSDIRSICDTRLYSSRKHRYNTNRKKRFEDYNDSAVYDVIPVKEKSSPKSRRKFVEDNMLLNNKYKEVPPSPRTRRPRLNLQAQFHTENDEESVEIQVPYKPQRKQHIAQASNVSNISSEVFVHNGNRVNIQKSQIPNTIPYDPDRTQGYLRCPILTNGHTTNNNDTTLNTQTTDISADKTEQTLSEIKDILQSFLLEIKKESSQSDKLDNSHEVQQQNNNRNVAPKSDQTFNNTNSSFGQYVPPFIQPMTNPCCYPILPICPMANCMPNGFVVPSPSCTCATYENHSKERMCDTNITNCSKEANSETQKLIKEIHKLISQQPNSLQRQPNNIDISAVTKRELNHTNIKTLTSRSVGGSSKASKHDAKVGTPKMKSYSKSCEAIGSQVVADRSHLAHVCYSDTVLEKESGEEITTMQSSSESECSIESTVVPKRKRNRFTKVFKSIGLFNKNKNKIVEELSESSTEVQIPKSRPPFQHHIMNYNMHGQEYFHSPPIPTYPHHPAHQRQYEYYGLPPHYNPRNCYSPRAPSKINNSHNKHPRLNEMLSPCTSPHHMATPPCLNYYDPHYGNVPLHVPVCLKEIEVKSIGTQSVRKMSMLEKFTNKIQVQKIKVQSQQSSSQSSKDKPATNLFDWKKLEAKAMKNSSDPFNFSYKTQKRLAEGDMKMRNAMIKKLFHKRNPFSPRNLLIRTLLGKDRSSFGEPPKMYKPRMFL